MNLRYGMRRGLICEFRVSMKGTVDFEAPHDNADRVRKTGDSWDSIKERGTSSLVMHDYYNLYFRKISREGNKAAF